MSSSRMTLPLMALDGTASEGWERPLKFSSHFADGETETSKGGLPEVTPSQGRGGSSRL